MRYRLSEMKIQSPARIARIICRAKILKKIRITGHKIRLEMEDILNQIHLEIAPTLQQIREADDMADYKVKVVKDDVTLAKQFNPAEWEEIKQIVLQETA